MYVSMVIVAEKKKRDEITEALKEDFGKKGKDNSDNRYTLRAPNM